MSQTPTPDPGIREPAANPAESASPCGERFREEIPEPLRRQLRTRMLLERATRLLHLVKLDAPGAIVCGEVQLVLEAAFVLYPESMGDAFASMIRDQALAKLGICRDCYGERERPDLCCAACEAEFIAEMEREGWNDDLDHEGASPGQEGGE